PRETFLLVPAERGEGALLQHLQQLDLHRYRRLADLVEEQRAVRIAALEDALVVLDRAGEGALAVAEELRLDQRLRELRQVDRDEALGEVGREPALLHDVRDELRAPDRGRGGPLSGPGFAEEKCREILHAIPERGRSEEHTSELQSLAYLVCRLLLEKK